MVYLSVPSYLHWKVGRVTNSLLFYYIHESCILGLKIYVLKEGFIDLSFLLLWYVLWALKIYENFLKFKNILKAFHITSDVAEDRLLKYPWYDINL